MSERNAKQPAVTMACTGAELCTVQACHHVCGHHQCLPTCSMACPRPDMKLGGVRNAICRVDDSPRKERTK